MPRYPNQQLRFVGLETFFAGRLAALTALEQLQDQLTDMPHLFVPSSSDGDAVALKPYQLRSDTGEFLAVAVNQASFISEDYPGVDEFLARGEKLLSRVYPAAGVRSLNRVIYRYQNEIDIARYPDGRLALDRVFDADWLARANLANADSVRFDWVESVSKTERLGTVLSVERDGSREVLRLNLAGAVVAPIPVDRLAVTARIAHDLAQQRFERMICEDFRRELQGDADDVSKEDED